MTRAILGLVIQFLALSCYILVLLHAFGRSVGTRFMVLLIPIVGVVYGLASSSIASLVLLSGCGPSDTNQGDAGPIEATFQIEGSWAITSSTATDSAGATYVLHHPIDLGTGEKKHAILTWANGTGGRPSNYSATLQHLASWGFVVIASDSPQTGYGTEVWAGAQHLLEQNSTSSSIFYQKLDPSRVGSVGHSQGATGAVNAQVLSSGVIGSTVAINFVDPAFFSTQAQMPDWTKVKAPVLFLTGAKDFLTSVAGQQAYLGKLAGPGAKAAIRNGDHNVIQKANNGMLGYLTAWLLYTLESDAVARGAFVGTPEINANPNWLNQEEKNLP